MDIHLVDGTYELFRHFYAVPDAQNESAEEIGAVRAVLGSLLSMLERGATHIAVATDHVIESFRNQLYPHYKTGDGIDPALWSQFPLLELSLQSMGVKVWPMVEVEADDALASAAVKAALNERVSKVYICTPDKDLSQCVIGSKIVQLDRMRNIIRDENGVQEKFGVKSESIPDYLALVGDTADGFPGIEGWGAKSTASVLSFYPHLEDIPKLVMKWDSSIRSAKKLSANLNENWDNAILFRQLATLKLDVPVFDDIDELRWEKTSDSFEEICTRLNAAEIFKRAKKLELSK